MATDSHTQSFDQTQTFAPGVEVLTSLVQRLRDGARRLRNAEARRTMGKDMVAAADAIEQMLLEMPVEVAATVAMVALLGRRGYAAWTGEVH